MDSRKMAQLCRELAENRKAEDIVVLDVRELSSVTDYFVIATGTSQPHLRAILEELTEKLGQQCGLRPRAVDGTLQTSWIVLDYFDVIIHIMERATREHYNLEELWGDARRLRARRRPVKANTPLAPGGRSRSRSKKDS